MPETGAEGSPWYQHIIEGLQANCGHDNWDGYQSHAVTDAAMVAVAIVLDQIEVTPSNDGSLTISSLMESVEVMVSPEGRVTGVYLDVVDADEQMRRVADRLVAGTAVEEIGSPEEQR